MGNVSTGFLKAALNALYYTRLDALLAPITQGSGVIFMLHHVLPGKPAEFAPNRILTVTPEFLELVIEHVQTRDFDIVSMDEAHERMASDKSSSSSSSRRFATFTFDDGYRDNIEHALPIFEKHGVPMTVYLAPDFCDGDGQAWWLTLETVLTVSEAIDVPFVAGEKRFSLTTPAEKWAAYREIYPWLRAMPDSDLHVIVNGWAEKVGVDPLAACRDLVLSWDEVRAAAKHPLVTFGAHTMSHTALSKCSDDEVRWQIQASIEHVEHELGIDCRHFAYPYGDRGSAGAREFEIAREAGLRTAVTTQKGLIGTDVRDRLTALPRFSLNGEYQDERHVQVLLSGAPFKMLDLARSALPRRAA